MEEDTGKLTHLGSDTGRIEGATTSLHRLQPGRRAADRDRHQADRGHRRAGTGDRPRLRDRAAGPVARLGCFRCPDGSGLDALRLERVAEAQGRNGVRHPHRDQERELAQERRGGGPLRDAPPGSGSATPVAESPRRPGTSTRTATPRRAAARRPRRTTGTSPNPIWSRWRPTRELVERLRQTIPELPWLPRKRIQEDWGISDEVMRDLVNAGAVDLVAATVEQGASSESGARVVGKLPGAEGQRGRRRARRAARSPRRRWPRWSSSSTRASCPTSWPARSSRACWPVRASPSR